jgi:hypothetical protein
VAGKGEGKEGHGLWCVLSWQDWVLTNVHCCSRLGTCPQLHHLPHTGKLRLQRRLGGYRLTAGKG